MNIKLMRVVAIRIITFLEHFIYFATLLMN